MRIHFITSSLLLSTAFAGAGYAKPTVVKVSAQANIYGAGQAIPPGGGLLPPSFTFPAGTQCVTFTKVKGSLRHSRNSFICPTAEGCITLDHKEREQTHLNDPDGAGAYPPKSSNTGAGSISGITAPLAGYLVGLFVPAGGPSGPAPTALDFTSGTGTGFATLAPALDQTFFIGDGLTGDDTGLLQTFSVPSGATALYLGISDADGWNGPPGAYFDNEGTFVVTVQASAAVCPAVAK